MINSRLYNSSCKYLQVMMTTLLKVYIKGGLFDRSRELLSELESAGYAENEVVRQYYFSVKLAVYILEKSNTEKC